jgi:hypothetical protein
VARGTRPSDPIAKIDAVAAVLAACGFSLKWDLLAQWPALNLEVAAKIEQGEPLTVAEANPRTSRGGCGAFLFRKRRRATLRIPK